MPSVSEPQRRLMAGIANGWHPSGMKHAPSKAVAKEFFSADKKLAHQRKLAQRLRQP